MKLKKITITMLLMICVVGVGLAQSDGYTVTVKISNIESADGKMLVGLYSSEENWLEVPNKGLFGKISEGSSEVVFNNVPNGIYAISTFHDADDDGELDTFLGIPTEATGCSNNAPANFGPPKWSDAKFEVKGVSVVQSIIYN